MLNQGWLSESTMDMRFCGSFCSIIVIRCLTSSEIWVQSSGSNSNFYYRTRLKISLLLSPSNGGYPHSMMKRMTPRLQTSQEKS